MSSYVLPLLVLWSSCHTINCLTSTECPLFLTVSSASPARKIELNWDMDCLQPPHNILLYDEDPTRQSSMYPRPQVLKYHKKCVPLQITITRLSLSLVEFKVIGVIFLPCKDTVWIVTDQARQNYKAHGFLNANTILSLV